MRFKHVLQNGLFSIGKQILITLLGLVNRTIFIWYLGMEYLGYTSLFSNILTWLSFAEGGFCNVMAYRLFQANANDDTALTASIMKLYRRVYTCLGIGILLVGISITGLTPYFIQRGSITLDTFSLYKIYWLQLLAVVVGYFGSYWRAFIQAKQEGYLCEGADSFISILSLLAQFLVLFQFRSLYGYLAVKIVEAVGVNLLIYRISQRRYPNALRPEIPALSLRKSGIGKDLKNYLSQKAANLVYSATDSIVISRFCGIVTVGIYSNYLLIFSTVQSLLFAAPYAMAQASISDFLNSENENSKKNLIDMLDLLTAIYAAALCCGFLTCFQPTITWWLGEEALLPFSFVVLLMVNSYIGFAAEPLYKIRATYGDYEQEIGWMSLSAVCNLVLSVALVQKWGVAGVEVGTIAGILFIVAGRIKFASTHCVFFEILPYLKKHLYWALLFVLEAFTAHFLTRSLPPVLWGILLRGVIAVGSSVAINVLALHRTQAFQAAWNYLTVQFYRLRKNNIKEE